jgi:glycosyltransferase involved in cell wall biosynthesis
MADISFSIITPCLNRVQYIGAAIESAKNQDYPVFEHIIMDGCSTDGTLDLLRKYPHLIVSSEPDQGMYDALNKGIARSHGNIISLLNSDDTYTQGALKAVVEAFEQYPNAEAVVGGTEVFVEDEKGLQIVHTEKTIESNEFWFRIIQGHPGTNAWFFRRQVFERLGGFDTRLRWSADRKFLIHITLDGGIRPIPIHKILYSYRRHSGSATITTLDSRDPGYGFTRINTLQEDIFLLSEFLQRKKLPSEIRRRMLREHGERCYRLAATAAYHHKRKIALRAVITGLTRNLFWPFVFMDMAIKRLVKELPARHG